MNTNYKVPYLFNRLPRPKPSIVYDTYWKFAAKRQEIFFNRFQGDYPPWSKDPILNTYKFTNVYRAADRVSQYLIKEVIYNKDQQIEELFFRIILFKLFNKIETWELLEKAIGPIKLSTYCFKNYDQALLEAKKRDIAIYSGAYIMASGCNAFGYKNKHQNHLRLIEKMVSNKLYDQIRACVSMQKMFELLSEYPTIGPFMAYQLCIDINYSTLTNFSEMEFAKAGPGAIDGIKKCFNDIACYSQEDIIKIMCEQQEIEFDRLGIQFKDLWGRPLQLIDCQNLFCEVDKYSRVAHPEISGVSSRQRIKQKFKPISLTPISYFFPPKWNLATI